MPKSKTAAFSTRLSAEERETINRAAELLGCSPSSFIREAAMTQSRKILRDPEAFVIARIRRLMGSTVADML